MDAESARRSARLARFGSVIGRTTPVLTGFLTGYDLYSSSASWRSIQKAVVTGGFLAGGAILAANPVGLTVLGVAGVTYAVADLTGGVDWVFDRGERHFERYFEQRASSGNRNRRHPDDFGP